MCGRFAVIKKYEEIAAYYDAKPVGGESWVINYNVCPTQLIPVIVDFEDGRELRLMKWGLVPFWAKDGKIGASMINARAETVNDKPGFREAFKKTRCLVPASGFYEWQKVEKNKQPYYFSPIEGLFSFAGLWSNWKTPEGVNLESCTIVTTTANDIVNPIHDRMPVILGHNEWSSWIGKSTEPQIAFDMLKPLGSNKMNVHAVSTHVSSIKNNGETCIAPVNSA